MTFKWPWLPTLYIKLWDSVQNVDLSWPCIRNQMFSLFFFYWFIIKSYSVILNPHFNEFIWNDCKWELYMSILERNLQVSWMKCYGRTRSWHLEYIDTSFFKHWKRKSSVSPKVWKVTWPEFSLDIEIKIIVFIPEKWRPWSVAKRV